MHRNRKHFITPANKPVTREISPIYDDIFGPVAQRDFQNRKQRGRKRWTLSEKEKHARKVEREIVTTLRRMSKADIINEQRRAAYAQWRAANPLPPRKPPMTSEERRRKDRERKKLYNARPDVKAHKAAYDKQQRAKMTEADKDGKRAYERAHYASRDLTAQRSREKAWRVANKEHLREYERRRWPKRKAAKKKG
jgi:hypothetical protein